jgi:hypothetical protein
VQAVLSGGLVFLAVLAEPFFGFHVGRRQWVGVTITAAGLVVIRLTGGGARGGEPVDADRDDRRSDRLLRLRPRLQIGDGVEVIALTSVAANLAAIMGGILVFHEPIGSGPVEIGARFLAFCLVIAGAALMPAPMRATPDTA